MLTALLLSLLIAPASAGTPPKTAVRPPKATVQVWINRDWLVPGERARVHVRAERDGYLVVVHAEPGGRVRVLFPLEPSDDNFVKAGKKFEVKGRGDRPAFTVHDERGAGVVYAAFSTEPFHVDSLARQGHWDYGQEVFKVGDDAEAALTELATLMAGTSPFEYDLVRYDVTDQVAYRRFRPFYSSWFLGWDPWYSGWYPRRFGLFGGGRWAFGWRRLW